VRADGISTTANKADIQIVDFDRCARGDGGLPSTFNELELALRAADGAVLAAGDYAVVTSYTKTRLEAEAYLTLSGQSAGMGQSGTVTISQLAAESAIGTFDITVGGTNEHWKGSFNATSCP